MSAPAIAQSVELTEERAGMDQRASALVDRLDTTVRHMRELGMVSPAVHVYPQHRKTLCNALNAKRRKRRLPPLDSWRVLIRGAELRAEE